MGEGNSLVTTLPNWKTDIPVKLCVGAFHSETKTLLKVNSVKFSCSAAIWKDKDILLYTHKLPDTNTTAVSGCHQRASTLFVRSIPLLRLWTKSYLHMPSQSPPYQPRSWGQHVPCCFRFYVSVFVQSNSCLGITQSASVNQCGTLDFQIIPDLCC